MALEDGKIEESEKFVEKLDDEVDIRIGANSSTDKEKNFKDNLKCIMHVVVGEYKSFGF